MGLMATVNLMAIVLLSGTVARLIRDYRRQRKAGRKLVFDIAHFLELASKVDNTIWSRPAMPKV